MEPQFEHGILIDRTHDEEARQQYARSLRNSLLGHFGGTRKIYDHIALPPHVKNGGEKPANREQVADLMHEQPLYQFFSLSLRTAMERMWNSVIDSIERDLPAMVDTAAGMAAKPGPGSLRLNPDLKIPRYLSAKDIHNMPGGYVADLGPGDVSQGALYDRGTYLYSNTRWGPLNSESGETIAKFLREKFPGFGPTRILDMGCAMGNSTTALKQEFPDAEVTGLDVGASMLRYAHARARSLALDVHFVQADAESTGFPDEHFDLVCSALLLHETSAKALPAIIRESYRILKPGGLMIHMDVPQGHHISDPYTLFLYEWEHYNNNEYYMATERRTDVQAVMRDAGFDPASVGMPGAQSARNPGPANISGTNYGWPMFTARKPMELRRAG
jgi:SAM-dependent methyltransferase